jgi:hypothetical protein
VAADGDKTNAYEAMPEEVLRRAQAALEDAQTRVNFKRRDQFGHEEWRDSRRVGSGMRFVIDPHVDTQRGELPKVIWIGQGVPPERVLGNRDGNSQQSQAGARSARQLEQIVSRTPVETTTRTVASWAELPDWARQALAAGWSPPPGWKPSSKSGGKQHG